ncbi:response regulator transcription factor [Rhodococcus koreensis]|uniref:helix-turn-helix transcriptional regulator n=1 Tax=Rhodococcus koreensis TaxID=99653 RepID=UPI003671B6D3
MRERTEEVAPTERVRLGRRTTSPIDVLDRLSGDVADAIEQGLLESEELSDIGRLLIRLEASRLSRGDQRARHFEDTAGKIRDLIASPPRDGTMIELLETNFTPACTALGFRRSLLSTVENGTWQPEFLHVDNALSDSHAPLKHYLGQNVIDLVSAPLEADAIRRQIPHLVISPHTHQLTYKPLMTVSDSQGYAVAPLVSRARVIGMIHVDQFDEEATRADLEKVTFLSEMMGMVAERIIQNRRLASLMERVANIVAYSENLMAGHADIDVLDSRGSVSSSRTSELLTPRQHQVLGDLAAGLSNAEIARKLGVSEGTVKSHVKQIFHKLGVHTRAAASAAYRSDRTAGSAQ